jgi:hypothetical protein
MEISKLGIWSRFVYTVAILFFSSCAISVGAGVDTPRIIQKNDKPVLLLPKSLTKYIKATFPGFRIPTGTDMVGKWATYSKKDAVPYACLGDFNGDGRTDVALMLIREDKWRIVAFQRMAEDGWEWERLTPYRLPFYPNFLQGVHIYTLKAGQMIIRDGKSEDSSKKELDTIIYTVITEKPDQIEQHRWVGDMGYVPIAYNYEGTGE